ncbi:hypothetical protein ACWD5V_29090 [Streptomyces sp. NPDC002523]
MLGTVALSALTAGIIEVGGRRATAAACALALAAGAGWLFVRAERGSADPLIPAELTGSVPFRWSLLTGFFFNFTMLPSTRSSAPS